MASKTTKSKARAASIFAAWKENSNGVSEDDLSYLRRYLRSDAEYARQLKDEYGFNVSMFTSNSVKNAKNSYDTYLFTPAPNRGKVGQDTASMIMRSGMRTNQTSPVTDVEIKESKVGNRNNYLKATPEGGRTRTDGEVQAIVNRGRRGATLNLEDQRIYDRYVTKKREEAQAKADAEARDKAQKAANEQYAKERAEKFQYLGIKDDGTLNDLQIEELIEKRNERNKTEEEIYRQKLEEDAENERFNSDFGIDSGTHLSNDAKKLIRDGKKKWGYTPEAQEKIDSMNSKLQDFYLGGTSSEEDRANLENERLDYLNRVKKQLVDIPEEELTGEQAYNRTRTKEMSDGTVLAQDNQGKWYKLWEPSENAEDKRKEKNQDRRDKYIDSRAEMYEKNGVTEGKDAKGNPIIRDVSYAEALALAQRDAAMRFGEEESIDGDDVTEEWQFGTDYDLDVEHGYRGSYDDWLYEFGGGAQRETDEQEIPNIQPMVSGHVKNSYL